MFMFRQCRKAALVKKLRRHLRRRHDEEEAEAEAAPRAAMEATRLLRRLSEGELEALLRAVQSEGALEGSSCLGDCVLASRRRCASEPASLTCAAFRWPDLCPSESLRRLPVCGQQAGSGNHGDADVQCCNPYHYSRRAAFGGQGQSTG